MRKKFVGASVLAVVLLVLSGSSVHSTYSATTTVTPFGCHEACVYQLNVCMGSGQPRGRCLGQYHSCNNKCK